MKKYEYVSIRYRARDLIAIGVSGHREIIDDYAARGYRYVDSIITEIDKNARIRSVDLVFEIDA